MSFEIIMNMYVLPAGCLLIGISYLLRGRKKYDPQSHDSISVKDEVSLGLGILFLAMALSIVLKNIGIY